MKIRSKFRMVSLFIVLIVVALPGSVDEKPNGHARQPREPDVAEDPAPQRAGIDGCAEHLVGCLFDVAVAG